MYLQMSEVRSHLLKIKREIYILDNIPDNFSISWNILNDIYTVT